MSHARAAARHVLQTLHGLWLTAKYPFSTRRRFLVTAWTTGLMIVGAGGPAQAADGFIVGPPLGGAGQTLFEKFDASAYTTYVDTDSDHSGMFGTSQLYDFLNGVVNMILWLGLTLLRGAITCVQWFLHMDLYHDNTGAIDSASSALNAAVFLPLLAVTLPIAGFAIYTRARQSGGGSIGNDLAWMVATAILAMTIVAQPSQILGYADTARTAIATHVMSGYSTAAGQQASATGYANPAPDGTQGGAIRQVSDGLWEVYGVNSWCYVAWKSLDTCKIEAQSYLADPSGKDDSTPWGQAKARMADDGDYAPFNADTGWVRGQDFGRLGAAILFLIDQLVAAVCLLVFVFFGLMSLIGVIILIFLGAVILPAWPIPGPTRQWGNRWLEMTLGTFLQSALITTLVGAVMVCGAIFSGAVPIYGMFMVSVLNLTVLGLGLRYRAQLEHMIGFGTGATGGSAMTSIMAARTLGRMSRMGGRAFGGAAKTGAGLGQSTVGASRTIAGATGRATATATRASYQKLAPLAKSTGQTLRKGASDVGALARADVAHYRGRKAGAAPSAPPIPVPPTRTSGPQSGSAGTAPTLAPARPSAPAAPAAASGQQSAPRMAAPTAARPTPPPPPPTAAPGGQRAAQPARMATPTGTARPVPPKPAPATPKPPVPAGYYSMKPIGGGDHK